MKIDMIKKCPLGMKSRLIHLKNCLEMSHCLISIQGKNALKYFIVGQNPKKKCNYRKLG